MYNSNYCDSAIQAELVRDALRHIDAGCSRTEWVCVGMAVKAAGLDFADWHQWCATASNYQNEADCRAVWNSMKGAGITAASLFAIARKAGWRGDVGPALPLLTPSCGRRKSLHDPLKELPKVNETGAVSAALWNKLEAAPINHGYFVRKHITLDGMRVASPGFRVAGYDCAGWLAVPVWNIQSGELQSIQFVSPEAGPPKLSLPGCKISGGVLVVHQGALEGRPVPAAFLGDVVYLAEGVATAVSINQATRHAALATFGKSNLGNAARTIRKRYPSLQIVLCPDRGAEGEAASIAVAIGGPVGVVKLPEDQPPNFDANDYASAAGVEELAGLLKQSVVFQVPEVWPPGDGSVSAFLDTPAPAHQWHFDEQMPAGRAVLLSAIGGSSKTRAVLHMAVGSVIGHLPWQWTVSRTGSAALLLTEDTPEDVHRAIRAIAEHSDLTADESKKLAKRLLVFPMAGNDSRLLSLAPGGVLELNERGRQFFDKLRAVQDLVFIGLDPALALTEGDEMNPVHQRRLGEFADRLAIETGACVVLTSHAAKAVQGADEIGSHTSRGSGAITDAVRAEYVLRTMTVSEARKFGIKEIEERKMHVQLLATKGNALAPAAFVPLWLKRGPGGVLLPADLNINDNEVGPIARREHEAFDILRTLAQTCTPNLKKWQEQCELAGLVAGPSADGRRKAMARIRAKLVDAGLVVAGVKRDVFLPASSASDE